MQRRRFLRVSLWGSAVLLGFYGLARLQRADRRLPAAIADRLRCLSGKQGRILQAVALRILAGADPDPAVDGAQAQLLFIDGYLNRLADPLKDDVRALLELLEYSPLLRHGRRFSHLDGAQQDQVLQGFEHSRFDLLRQGFFALKSLCCLAHYQDERSFAAIGYSGPLLRR